jgi:hypothetical protein
MFMGLIDLGLRNFLVMSLLENENTIKNGVPFRD